MRGQQRAQEDYADEEMKQPVEAKGPTMLSKRQKKDADKRKQQAEAQANGQFKTPDKGTHSQVKHTSLTPAMGLLNSQQGASPQKSPDNKKRGQA